MSENNYELETYNYDEEQYTQVRFSACSYPQTPARPAIPFKEFILALGYKADYIKTFFLNQKALTSDFTIETKTHKRKFYLKNRKKPDDFTITFVF